VTRDETPSRRQVLAGLASAAVAGSLAGCARQSADGTPSTSPAGYGDAGTAEAADTTADTMETADTTTEDGGASDESLDLREANVVDATIERVDGGYRFDVALHHDDAGEDGYANWWQVERLDGTRLGRRELLHAHDRQPFTRSATVEIPDSVSCVVVRGHDQTHGYGGQVLVVNLETRATRAIRQGSEPQSVDEADCP